VFDEHGRLLLVQRGREPNRGRWTLPGGRCEPGEAPAAAAVREVLEETGLRVVATQLIGQVDLPGPGSGEYAVEDFACTLVGGRLEPGDDADDARFVPVAELPALPLTPGLLDTLRGWGVLCPPC
jgi:ADP-ribose pyrophosphatase YjhB (NUDIX family)